MNAVIYISECASTNSEILHHNPEAYQQLSLYTFNQTKGRGQYGNIWESVPEENLAFSFCTTVKPQLSASLFNFHTALLVRDFLANLTDFKVKIKWPNDIIINDKKVCGMLIEKTMQNGTELWISGIGINILQTDFHRLPKAGSLLTQTGKRFDLKETAENLHHYFCEYAHQYASPESILESFNAHLFKRNEVAVFQRKGIRQNGIISFADEEGYLHINLEKDGLQKFFHKEIEMLY